MNTPVIQHRAWCTDPTIRSSETIFDRTIVKHRCIGCGASVTEPKPVTK